MNRHRIVILQVVSDWFRWKQAHPWKQLRQNQLNYEMKRNRNSGALWGYHFPVWLKLCCIIVKIHNANAVHWTITVFWFLLRLFKWLWLCKLTSHFTKHEINPFLKKWMRCAYSLYRLLDDVNECTSANAVFILIHSFIYYLSRLGLLSTLNINI